MPSPSAPRSSSPAASSVGRAVPYGLSFPVPELLMVRAWAGRHGMTMQVITDHVLDGAAFEELLLLRNAATCQRLLCLWRRADQVIAQKPDHRPTAFRSLDAALAALTPPPASSPSPRRSLLRAWLNRLTWR